jgi:hypothetical protein
MYINKQCSRVKLFLFFLDAYRKLAKLCVKTSIVENPSKLPKEAIDFATHRGKGSKKPSWYTEHPWP